MIYDKIKKIIKYAVSILGILIIVFIIYLFFFFNIFESANELVMTFSIAGNKNKIEIYHVPSNATVREAIVIMKVDQNNNSTRIDFVNDYKLVKRIHILNDHLFELVLGEEYGPQKFWPDTVLVVDVTKIKK